MTRKKPNPESKINPASASESRDRRLFHHGHSTLLSDLGAPLTTKASGLFALCAPNGDIDNQVNNGYGLYFHDTRFLEVARLRINRQPLAILLSSAEDDVFSSELTNPELDLGHGQVLAKDRIGIRRRRALSKTITETIEVANYSSDPVRLTLDFAFAASFESMFAIRGASPGKRGHLHDPHWSGKTLTFRYDGADKRVRTTTLSFDRLPARPRA
ncbi:MAG: hypothetical protein M3Z11_08780, partial [Candidatus Dormibacteraeota bacterium]|nr:hypothetical protein [Candidatus Dormibacteraeota bacterium]